jgi:HK97 family phage portal protein
MKPFERARRAVARVLAQAFTAVGGAFYWGLQGYRSGFHHYFQQGAPLNGKDSLLHFSAVFACVTGIASDIAKLRIKLCENANGIWTEITANQPWLSVLKRPNHFQNRIQFAENWAISKILAGNAYLLKERDRRGVVNGLYVLDPARVVPLVADNGDVYYQLNRDMLSRQFEDAVIVPAREIIHDRANCLYHPLIGISPLSACALSATMGNKIQENSVSFFQNRALPGGVISMPGKIDPDQVDRLEKKFKENYSGENFGNVWILGNDMKFDPITMTAEAAQLAEQLKWTVEDIARAFHYPMFKLGGELPPYAGNVEAMIISYYTDCLQILIESMELCLDEGLGLPFGMGTEFDIDNLMRMDTAALYKSNSDAVGGGWMSPDEARFRANYKPVAGGLSPYLQQQNYSLAALAKRDAGDDPFKTAKAQPTSEPALKPARDISLAEIINTADRKWEARYAAV